MTSRAIDSKSKESLQPWLVSLAASGISKDDMLKVYSDWNEKANYESDLLAGGYEAPALAVKYFTESYPTEERGNVKVLDVGAGTGMVARGLRQQGFCHIDALDPSEDMLALARKDALYENYICEFITDKQLPIPPDAYDGLTACGCFGLNHMTSDAIPELVRIVKPGGIIVIVSRASYLDTHTDFKDRLLPLMDRFVQEGKWKKLVAEKTGYYYLEHAAIVWKFQVTEKSA